MKLGRHKRSTLTQKLLKQLKPLLSYQHWHSILARSIGGHNKQRYNDWSSYLFSRY